MAVLTLLGFQVLLEVLASQVVLGGAFPVESLDFPGGELLPVVSYELVTQPFYLGKLPLQARLNCRGVELRCSDFRLDLGLVVLELILYHGNHIQFPNEVHREHRQVLGVVAWSRIVFRPVYPEVLPRVASCSPDLKVFLELVPLLQHKTTFFVDCG